jgi:dTDP-4-dehydrorhamnose reductase
LASPRILLLGRTGQVGFELERVLASQAELVALDRVGADLSRPESLRELVRRIRPQAIVNAAAYTAVDKAEQEEALATTVNGEAPGVLAEEAKRLGAFLVHYSTDYVFDGTKAGPYVEADGCAPLNAYGRSKLTGERAIQASGVDHVILRTTWVYGSRGSNFYLTMRRLFRERPEVRVVADQFGAPTWSRSIAEATTRILTKVLDPAALYAARDLSGIYHLAASGETSWHGFAAAILALHPSAPGQTPPRLVAIPASEYPTPAKRPANSRLDSSKVKAAFGVMLPDWHEMLAQVSQAG